jgi:hypothetical protein
MHHAPSDAEFWYAVAQLATLATVLFGAFQSWRNSRDLKANSIVTAATADAVNGHLTTAVESLRVANEKIADNVAMVVKEK